MQPFSCIKRQKSARADTSVCILPGQCLFGLDLIPLNFVCFHMKFKAAAIASVNHRILWLIGIIYHTVFAVLHVCMNFHIVVCGIPAVQLLLCRGRPENCTVKHTAVLKAVRQSADVNAAAFSEGLHRHLYFLVFLDQNAGFRKRKNILLAFPEIHGLRLYLPE